MPHNRDPKRVITVTTPPTNEPLTTDEAKTHLRVLTSDADTYIDDLVKYARELAEERMDRAIITTVFLAKYDGFPSGRWPLEIHRSPLISVASVQYYDADGTLQTWDSSKYQFDFSEPARLAPVNGESYPVTERTCRTPGIFGSADPRKLRPVPT